MSQKDLSKTGITRRDFIKTIGYAGAAAVGTSLYPRSSLAASKDHILIGMAGAFSGPVAAMSEPARWASELALAEINKDGGIFIKELGKKLPVKAKLMDTESNPTKSADVASRLILHDKVDLIVASGTPTVVNPVSAVCERYQVPSIGWCPFEPWMAGGPYKWAFLFFWGMRDIIGVYTGMWNAFADKTNKVVGGLWPNDEDGTVWSKVFTKLLQDMGYKVVDAGRFPFSQNDFTDFISIWKKERVEILTGVVPPPVWTTAWRQCHQQGFVPKMATIGKASLFPKAMEALGGNLAHGLTTEIWWSPWHPFKSSLSGVFSDGLADQWTAQTGKQWTQPIGFEYASWEIVLDALKRAGSVDKKKIREAMIRTNLDTIVGPIKFDKKNFALTSLVGGQWMKGKKWPWDLQITYNRGNAHIPTTGKMVFPIPQQ